MIGTFREYSVLSSLQGKLEEAVEMLSEMVNRPYLKTPQSKMSEAARNVDYLCEEYLTEMEEVAHAALLAQEESNAPRQQKPPSPVRPQRPLVFDGTLVFELPRTRPPGRPVQGNLVDSLEIYLFGNPHSQTGQRS